MNRNLMLGLLLGLASAAPVSRLEGKPAPVPIGSLSIGMHTALNATRATIMQWALVVDGAAAQDECDTPGRDSCDCTFWNGILCSNPHAREDVRTMACSALSRAQSADGMLWRSPWEASAQNSTNPDFFSRDQGLGTLAALTMLRSNQTFYAPWLSYITSHKGYMCPGMWDCRLTMPFWCTFDKVARFGDITEPSPSLMVPKLGAGVCNNDHSYVYVSTAVDAKGSALHLAALDVYIRRTISDWDAVIQAAADKLHSREPLNPFFQWLSTGASDDLGRLVLSQVPMYNKTRGSERKQWSFCRDDAEQAYKQSMGWEFVFLIDHLLAAPISNSSAV
eukprot:TRINITY_DN37023_c0_g2_i1.p1 TRINITY_DN37023_c0_g2~~TRINITY_DN37023_c0_g2_i1.p1  ORF type:complete len:335 (+),score=62.20 TRINITY_DN37023_c0_g2_i1:38-1042(+)